MDRKYSIQGRYIVLLSVKDIKKEAIQNILHYRKLLI